MTKTTHTSTAANPTHYGCHVFESEDGETLWINGHVPERRAIAAANHYARTEQGLVNIYDAHGVTLMGFLRVEHDWWRPDSTDPDGERLLAVRRRWLAGMRGASQGHLGERLGAVQARVAANPNSQQHSTATRSRTMPDDRPVIEGLDRLGPDCTCPESDWPVHRHVLTAAPDRPGDRDQQQAAEVMPAALYGSGDEAHAAIASAIAAARAEEAARWQALELSLRRFADDLEQTMWLDTSDRFAIARRLRAVLDGERQEHNLGVNGDWSLTHGEPYPHGDAS